MHFLFLSELFEPLKILQSDDLADLKTISETATKMSKNFVVTLQVQNYCHKYALQANKLWLQ